jgi:hypothetical protein
MYRCECNSCSGFCKCFQCIYSVFCDKKNKCAKDKAILKELKEKKTEVIWE